MADSCKSFTFLLYNWSFNVFPMVTHTSIRDCIGINQLQSPVPSLVPSNVATMNLTHLKSDGRKDPLGSDCLEMALNAEYINLYRSFLLECVRGSRFSGAPRLNCSSFFSGTTIWHYWSISPMNCLQTFGKASPKAL